MLVFIADNSQRRGRIGHFSISTPLPGCILGGEAT